MTGTSPAACRGMKKRNEKKSMNEGEGSKSAAKHYDDAATEFARSGNVAEKSAEAAKAVEESAEELQRAEDEGRRHSAGEDPLLRHPERDPGKKA